MGHKYDGLTDPRLGKRLVASVRLRRNELRVERAIKAALNEHRKHALAAIRQQRSLTASSPPDAFNMAGWDTSVDKAVKPVVSNVVDDLAGSTFSALNLPPETARQLLGEMDLDPRKDAFTDQIRSVGSTVNDRLTDEITMGVAKGETVDELEERIDRAFEIGENAAERISRTETHGIAEGSSYDSANAVAAAGWEVTKEWVATGDDRTRDSHDEADGQVVGIDETFTVGDSELAYPGDPDGDDEEVINCRCSVVYAMPDDSTGGSDGAGDLGDAGE